MHKKSTNGNQKSAMQEISQQLMSLFAKNTLRVELHTFQIPLAMANPHNLAAFRSRPSRQSTLVMSCGFHHQRMVACHGKWICQPPKYALTVMCNRRGFAVHDLCGAHNFARQMPAPLPDDRGRRQESASLPGIVANNVKGDPGFIWRTGAR